MSKRKVYNNIKFHSINEFFFSPKYSMKFLQLTSNDPSFRSFFLSSAYFFLHLFANSFFFFNLSLSIYPFCKEWKNKKGWLILNSTGCNIWLIVIVRPIRSLTDTNKADQFNKRHNQFGIISFFSPLFIHLEQ